MEILKSQWSDGQKVQSIMYKVPRTRYKVLSRACLNNADQIMLLFGHGFAQITSVFCGVYPAYICMQELVLIFLLLVNQIRAPE